MLTSTKSTPRRRGGLCLAALLVYWTKEWLEGFYGASSSDPRSFVLGAAVLIATALVANWAPAQRASRVDPAVVLRDQ